MNETETVAVTPNAYRVKLIGVLGSAAGSREIIIQGPLRMSVSELIERLLTQIDKRQFKELLVDSATNNPLPNVIMLLNDQDCNLFRGLQTQLEPETLVTIIPVAHGG